MVRPLLTTVDVPKPAIRIEIRVVGYVGKRMKALRPKQKSAKPSQESLTRPYL
jgi:hypothetical protein